MSVSEPIPEAEREHRMIDTDLISLKKKKKKEGYRFLATQKASTC